MVMCTNILQTLKTFRTIYKIPDKTKLHWFPGHMHKGLKVMQQKLKSIDCVIEVHDARIPLSGRNPNFKDTVSGLRPHVLVLNKVDLADNFLLDKTVEVLQKDSNLKVVFTNCKDPKCRGVKELINVVNDLIRESNRYNRTEEDDLCCMIIGVPNVGKSSLINTLRRRYLQKSKAVSVGAIAGITRSVGTKIKVSENPLLYIYDSPGILAPHIGNDVDVGMKLALCSTFKDSEIGIVNIADYLLFWLNKHKFYSYTSFLNLKDPTDDITEALMVSAATYKLFLRTKEFGGSGGYTVKPDLEKAAINFVAAFRKGTLGLFNLDCEYLT